MSSGNYENPGYHKGSNRSGGGGGRGGGGKKNEPGTARFEKGDVVRDVELHGIDGIKAKPGRKRRLMDRLRRLIKRTQKAKSDRGASPSRA